jgi:hypothetical protein
LREEDCVLPSLGLDSVEEEDGLVWLTPALVATEIIKRTRKIRFMLDLIALAARFQNPSLLGCKAAGGKVLLF